MKKSILSRIVFLERQDYLPIFRRKLFWILIPGLLAGLLAIVIVPDSGVPNKLVSDGPAPGITQAARGIAPLKVGIEDPQPNHLLFVLSATLVGLVVGVGLALFSELNDGSARRESELAHLTGIPVLASIPIIEAYDSAFPKNRHAR